MRTVTVNDSRTGGRYHMLDAETYDGVVSMFDRSLLADVYPLPADGAVRDDAHWQEEKHKRDKGGKFVGHGGSASGGKKGVNEVHFESKGVGGDHKLVPKNAKSKSLPHGMTVNQYIAEKHGGDVGKGLSYLKHYHGKGEFEFAAPDKAKPVAEPEVQAKAKPGTPLTKGKNAQHYNSLGVTMEHELHAKTSMKSVPKGMTVKQYIDQKHGGDEGKALSWLKHHEKNGDLVIKSPGGGSEVKQKLETPLAGDSTSPVPVSQVKAAMSKAPELESHEEVSAIAAAKTVKPKLALEEKAAAVAEAAKAKIYAKFGVSPDHRLALKSTDYKGQYEHGQALKDNPHVQKDLAGALKHFKQNEHKVSLVAPGQQLKAPELSHEDFLAAYGNKIIQSLKPGTGFQDWAGSHGKSVDKVHGAQTGHAKNIFVGQLKQALQTGAVKLHEPGYKASPLSESHAEWVDKQVKEAQAKAETDAAELKKYGEAHHPLPTTYHAKSDYDKIAATHLKPSGQHYTAMKAYSGSAFADINNKLRTGKHDQLSPSQKQTVKHLEEFTNKSRLQHDMTVFRGMTGSGYETLKKLKVGDDFASGQFNSVSTNHGVAKSFAGGNHIMIIRAKKGARGGFMGNASKFEHEQEIVLPHDAKLRFAGRNKDGHFVFDHHE